MEAGMMEQMRQLALSFPSSALGQGQAHSYPHNGDRWGWDSTILDIVDVEVQSQFVYDWFVQREPGLRSLVSELADGLTSVKAERTTGTQKVIRDGHLYIVKDGMTFSPDGKRVR